VVLSEANVDYWKPPGTNMKLAFLASTAPVAEEARVELVARYGDTDPADADVIVALGGDGFMLRTLHRTQSLSAPVYGMNRGTIGFLMNEYECEDLLERLSAAQEEVINPLAMTAMDRSGQKHEALAINEVSLLRAGPQAAKLRISIDGRERLNELVCDGCLLATPAGSTALSSVDSTAASTALSSAETTAVTTAGSTAG